MILLPLALCALLGLTTAQTGSYATPSAPNPSDEICPQFQFDSESRLDCSRTTCLAPLNSTVNCLQYCEIRRVGFVGPVGIPQTSWNGTTDAWEAKDLPAGEGTPGAGELVDVLTGINQTSWMENAPGMQAIRESVGYECMYSSPRLFNPPPPTIYHGNGTTQKQKLTAPSLDSTSPQNTYNQGCKGRSWYVRDPEEVAPRTGL